jgi:phosphorylcholine metabolism protein LicD
MKFFIAIFLSIFFSKNCESQTKNEMQSTVLEYTANTRGFFQKIIIQDQRVSISNDRNENPIPLALKISDSDWKELVSYLENLELENLASLKAPTEKRIYDGAASANLKVISKKKTYQTVPFDHGYPPEKIKKLIDKINSFANKKTLK